MYPPTEINKIYEIPACKTVFTRGKMTVSPGRWKIHDMSLKILHFTVLREFPNSTAGTGITGGTWLTSSVATALREECQRQEMAECFNKNTNNAE